MKFITINELLRLKNANIIDIRNKLKYQNNHIPNSINIDEIMLLSNPEKYLNKDEIYYIYCDFGNRSKRVTYQLNKLGYNTVNVDGGYNNYLLR